MLVYVCLCMFLLLFQGYVNFYITEENSYI